MYTMTAEMLKNSYEICREEIGDEQQVLSHGLKKDLIKESKIFSITNRLMVVLKPEMCHEYDDVNVVKSEQAKTDLIERLRAEIKKVDDRLINHD